MKRIVFENATYLYSENTTTVAIIEYSYNVQNKGNINYDKNSRYTIQQLYDDRYAFQISKEVVVC